MSSEGLVSLLIHSIIFLPLIGLNFLLSEKIFQEAWCPLLPSSFRIGPPRSPREICNHFKSWREGIGVSGYFFSPSKVYFYVNFWVQTETDLAQLWVSGSIHALVWIPKSWYTNALQHEVNKSFSVQKLNNMVSYNTHLVSRKRLRSSFFL